jgi:starch-binding outer membrane protein, SusD/RagB family
MKLKTLAPVVLLAMTVVGCQGVLDVKPINEFPEDEAIINTATARAAVAGMFDALQGGSYYGGTFLHFGDLSAEDVQHTGTFTNYRLVDGNNITSDNGAIEGIWDGIYRAIGRANIILVRIPTVPDLDPAERDEMLATAYIVRALSYHNLVKYWGDTAASGMGVPLRLTPPANFGEAAQITRATTGAVYTQILSDLSDAELLVGPAGVISAIRARVMLYQKNWAGAEAQAEAVAAMGYSLTPKFEDLFTPNGTDTPEDIFKLTFTAVDFNLLGFYYRAKGAAGGRREITPTNAFAAVFSPGFIAGQPATYQPVDKRGQWSIAFQGTVRYGSKYPTGIGAEDLHVIRFAEVLLIEAEAEARQNKLVEAEASLLPIRTRAGLTAARVDTMTQANAIATILQERRLELCFEGDRWPDLVRNGLAVSTLGLVGREFQTRYPIPLNEIDVAPGLVQNPGY